MATMTVAGDVKDLALAVVGLQRILWAERDMPVLRAIKARFEAEKPLAGLRMSACLHVTAETANLARTLQAGGADLVLVASNPLSTQDDVAASLVNDFNIPVFAIKGEDESSYYRHIAAALKHRPHVTMDDGADLVGAMIFIALGRMTDLHEEVRDWASTLSAGKRVVVAGYGWCGKGVAMRAKGLGAHVIVTEVDPIRALEAAMDGFEVMEMARAAPIGDLFITVTGNMHVVRGEHFSAMKDGAMVCNSGHFNVELALDQLADVASTTNRGIREFVDEYVLPNGKRVYILGEGRLINLAAAHGHPASVMDMSFAAQALATEWSLKMKGRLEHRVYNVPKAVDEWVASLKLRSMGIGIDALTPDQAKYLDGWETGT